MSQYSILLGERPAQVVPAPAPQPAATPSATPEPAQPSGDFKAQALQQKPEPDSTEDSGSHASESDHIPARPIRQIVNMHAAKTHLSHLVERALAGEEIIIARAGKPLIRLTPA